ncbi:MAG: DUF5615 family PIN-like protein [Verrucomicrobiota bacterium JB022]|nr:DUF5615 family PIN-like protein [Verrucomicrobiota bacterium JB022]
MKLLFDENLSSRLPEKLVDLFPASKHVRDFDLRGADDINIWYRARSQGYAIVSKDDDFREAALMHGPPSKVVILGLGNCSTKAVEELLRHRVKDIAAFIADPEASLLELP